MLVVKVLSEKQERQTEGVAGRQVRQGISHPDDHWRGEYSLTK
jgi:hypothetical protein